MLKIVNHFHTDVSKFDSAALVGDMVKKAAEYGAEAMAITEHGNMASLEEFLDCCKGYGMKAIPGVEAYYHNSKLPFRRSHLVLHAKNLKGYHQIAKAVTESNHHLEKETYPVMNDDILMRFFGPGTDGHENVIATSACMSGPLGTILLHNDNIIKKSKRKLINFGEKYHIPVENFQSVLDNQEKEVEHLNQLTMEKKLLTEERAKERKVANQKFTAKKNRIAKLEGTEAYKYALEQLNKEIQFSKDASLAVKRLDQEIKDKQKEITKQRNLVNQGKGITGKITNLFQRIRKDQNACISQEAVSQCVDTQIQRMMHIFGKDNFWIEIQNHRVPEELKIMPVLVQYAKKYGLQTISANDAHMVNNSEDDFHAREIMRSAENGTWRPLDQYARELYIKTDEELRSILSELNISADDVEAAMQGSYRLIKECNVIFKKEEHYPKFLKNGGDINAELEKAAYAGLKEKGLDQDPIYQKRIRYELNIIESMGYADYHMIVKDFLEVGRLIGKLTPKNLQYLKEHVDEMSLNQFMSYINENANYIGYSIGPGRGSAAGSLVCFCLGITSIDPLKNNLLFERFLNPERVSMPDIDSDIHTEVRYLLIEYVKKKYGQHSTCCIMTQGRYQIKEAIRTAGRVLSVRYYKDKGVLLPLVNEIIAMVEKANEQSNPCEGCTKPCEKCLGCQKIFQKISGYVCANVLETDQKLSKAILHDASLVYGRLYSFGMHAAGVVIADNGDVREYIPLLNNVKKKQWTSQCDMVKIEENGLLKMDFLGLRNLNVLTDTIRMVYERTGRILDFDHMEMNDKQVFDQIFAKGDTNSVFQFESDGMKDMLRRFKPSSFEDLAILVAMYRPGPMQYIDSVIETKHGRKKVSYATPALKGILEPTYGAIVYQEQVQQIFQKLAGYSLGQADLVRRAMSKKKEKVLEKERAAFVYGDMERKITGCKNNGISENIANQLFDEMMEFAKYAFNKSHACAYAKVAYMTAYCKCYYPLEYLTATLNYTDIKKAQPIFEDLSRYKIKVLAPDINISQLDFVIHDEKVLFGLTHIPNVGVDAEKLIQIRKISKFVSFRDFFLRVRPGKSLFNNLLNAGAFQKFGSRQTIAEAKDYYTEQLKVLEKQKNEIEKAEKDFLNKKTEALKKRAMEKIKNLKEIHRIAEDEFEHYTPPFYESDHLKDLADEYELLGVFVSGHPMDHIETNCTVSKVLVRNYQKGYRVKITGVILNKNAFITRKKQQEMCFFDFEDQEKRINVVCFSQNYEKYKDQIHDFHVMTIVCRVGYDEDKTMQFYLEEVLEEAKGSHTQLLIEIPEASAWMQYADKIRAYRNKQGCKLLVYCKKENFINTCDFTVSANILEDELLQTHMERIGKI